MDDYEFLRDYLYFNGDAPNPLEFGNVNEKGDIDISDITLLIEILKENNAPIFTATPAIPSSILEGQSHVFKVQVYDADGDPIEIKWYLDSELVSTTNEYNFTSDYAGVYTIKVVISDGELSNFLEFNVRVGKQTRIMQAIYGCQDLDVENRAYSLQNDITTSGTCFVVKANKS